MYLSRLILDPKSRAVRRDLADCQDLHRTVMSGFPQSPTPGDSRARFGVLYRADTHPRTGQIALLVQSQVAPDWSALAPGYLLDTGGNPRNPESKCVDLQYGSLKPGMVLLFRLQANPARKIDTKSGPSRQRRNGKRVELRSEEEQIKWLARKGEGAFRLLSVRANPQVPNVRAAGPKLVGSRRSPGAAPGDLRRVTLASVLLEGALQVTDPNHFRELLQGGVGPGKAYGCGLLSVAPAMGAP